MSLEFIMSQVGRLTLPSHEQLLRMAHKYFIDDLRVEIESALSDLFPSTLTQYRSDISTDPRLNVDNTDFNGLAAITLGEKFYPAILPVAYYECAISDIKETLDGKTINGTLVTLAPEYQRKALIFRQLFYEHKINRADFLGSFRYNWPHPLDLGCKCATSGLQFAGDLSTEYKSSLVDVFMLAQAKEENDWEACKECVDLLIEMETGYQEEAWSRLPRWCGRESWEALLQKDLSTK